MRLTRQRGGYHRIETQMAPMIDVVFLLLIFFMLTLKVVSPEGDFSINMPIGAPAPADDELQFPPIKVRLTAGPEGELTGVFFNNKPLGNNNAAFDKLNGLMASEAAEEDVLGTPWMHGMDPLVAR